MVPPPGGPGVVAILEKRYTNGLVQDIILENNSSAAGQNVLIVRAYGPMGPDAGRGRLRTDIPSLNGVREEMRERFPGVHMSVSGLYAQNRYGPLGYATGRSRTGSNCLYVWQRIASDPGLFRVERGAITWRLRLCDPNRTQRQLLQIAYGFNVVGYFDSDYWNPYGTPPEPDERIGKPGEVIFPDEVRDDTVVAPVAFSDPPRRRRRASSTARRVAASSPPAARPTVVNNPAPGAAVVPRPQNTNLSEPVQQNTVVPSANAPATTVPAPGAPAPPGPASRAPTVRPSASPRVGGVAVPPPQGGQPPAVRPAQPRPILTPTPSPQSLLPPAATTALTVTSAPRVN
ncbi:MAG: cellulose biosynthesis protein BcsN [Pseudomonadota bacterium]